MKKFIAFLMALMLVPFSAMAQVDRRAADFQAGKADGTRDGKAGSQWFAAGLCCGLTGVGAAYLISPSVPKQGLVGKSPEYTSGYIEGYENKAKKEQTKKAVMGCATLTVIYVGVVAIAAASDDSDDDYGYYSVLAAQ